MDFDKLFPIVKQVESGGNPNAVSPKGARGLMQTLPGTLRDPGYGVRPAKDESPAELERVGQDYLKAMYAKYGNLKDTLAAYNWGPGNVDKWQASGADEQQCGVHDSSFSFVNMRSASMAMAMAWLSGCGGPWPSPLL